MSLSWEVSMKLNLDAANDVVTTKPYTVKWQDAVSYALAIGATADQLDLLWESHPDFRVFPTFAVIPTFPITLKVLGRMNADLTRVVHGAQRVQMNRPIPVGEPLVSTGRVVDILDKIKGAVINISTETRTEAGEEIFTTDWSIFCRGQGDFGGERGTSPSLPEPLSDSKGWEGTIQTTPEQAIFYRLSGDLNPLHIDPELATKVGFKSPILHGLCTYGQAARLIMTNQYGGMWDRLRAFSTRFSREVYPGDAIQVKTLPTAESNCHRVEATVADRTVLSHGVLEVR